MSINGILTYEISGSFTNILPIINIDNSFITLNSSIENDIVTIEFQYNEIINNDGFHLLNINLGYNILKIITFGDIPLSRSNRQFHSYIGEFPDDETDIPILLPNTDISGCFDSSSFNGNISSWDLSSVVNNSVLSMFARSSYNNPSINDLNVSSITNFNNMFVNNFVFNQPLDGWDKSNAGDIQFMFNGASRFNQDISNWNTINVINMESTFSASESFNQNISLEYFNSFIDRINHKINMIIKYNKLEEIKDYHKYNKIIL